MPRNATYYRGDLRRDLMDAALEVIGADGPGAVSLRGLAKTLGVSHAAPANHFPDKRALFTALAREGFQLLDRAVHDAVAGSPRSDDPLLPLRAVGRAYVEFAVTHRAHYDVMWRADLADHTDPDLLTAGQSTLRFLTDGVTQLQRAGRAADVDARTLAVTLWSTAHGLAGLWLDGQLAMEFGDDLDGLTDGVAGLLARLAT